MIESFTNYNQCPWDQFEGATRHFCEAQLCQWVTKPAESWSNIGFIFVGFYFLKKAREDQKPYLFLFGFCAIVLGLFSGAFHITATRWGQILDVSAMMWLLALPFVFNISRIKPLSLRQVTFFYLAFSLFSLVFVSLWTHLGIAYFGTFLTIGVGLEIYIYKNLGHKADYRPYLKFVATFLLALGIWITDTFEIICDPDNHIFNGHAAWHLLCAYAIYFVYKFYNQFDRSEVINN